jgi:hypothetical protein
MTIPEVDDVRRDRRKPKMVQVLEAYGESLAHTREDDACRRRSWASHDLKVSSIVSEAIPSARPLKQDVSRLEPIHIGPLLQIVFYSQLHEVELACLCQLVDLVERSR